MRIAYLINQYPKVSHTFVRREILALERRGMEVMRIALRGWHAELVDKQDQSERERTRYVLRDGVPALIWASLRMLVTRPAAFMRAIALACRMSRGGERPLPVHLVYFAEACRVAIWLRTVGIEHLHAHFGTNSAEVAMLAHALGGPPWSFTVHGPEEFDKAPLIGLAEKVRRCAFAVAISSYGRSQLFRLVAHEYWPKVLVVPCGLDPEFFQAPATTAPVAGRLVCVGRLSEQKGQLLLVQAAHRLAAEGREFQLVLVGDGEMRAAVEALIARHNLQTRVNITGWISNDQVRNEILASRAMVLPSFAEGLPVVIMEAMALNRAVISTYVAGIPELVHDGEHGWLVPAGDVGALTAAMKDCLDASVDELTRMGMAAQKRVQERHDADKAAAQLGALFQSVIDGRSVSAVS